MAYAFTYRMKHNETKTTSNDYGHYFKPSIKIKVQPTLVPLLRWVDLNRSQLEQNLRDFIAIPSVYGVRQNYDDVIGMMKKVLCWLRKLNIRFDTFNVGKHRISGEQKNIPPVIIATLTNDRSKPTIGVYGHIDVNYTNENDWNSKCPYKLTIVNDHYYGAGTASGKGPLLMWFEAIQAFQECHIELPVNIVFVIESTFGHHHGLERFLCVQRTGLLRDIDHWIVCEKTWIGKSVPCISYGMTGFVHFCLSAEKTKDSNRTPREDLEIITKTMVNDMGEILIDGFNRSVQRLTPDEERIYEDVCDFDFEAIRNQLPDYKKSWSQKKFLMSQWRLPELNISTVEECTCAKKDTMPEKVKCLLLFKIVPNQIPETVVEQVVEHTQKAIKDKQIQNNIQCKFIHSVRPWIIDCNCLPIQAAKRALTQIYKVRPNLIREDESLEILLILDRTFNNDILLLPLSNSNSNPRKPNENISSRCYFEGIKLICAYMFQFAQVKMSNK